MLILKYVQSYILSVPNTRLKSMNILPVIFIAGDSGLGEESSHFVDENTDGRFYTEDEHIHVLLEFSHKYVAE